ncbi:MAG: YkgJ family cysteine cluster protein [Pseudomonadota bacterium]
MQPQMQELPQEPSLTSLLAIDPQQLADQMLEPTTMQAIYEDSEAIISTNRSTDGLVALVENAIATMETLWGDLEADAPAYACAKGCSWCCHQSVMVTAPEVVHAAKFLHDNLTEDEVMRLRDRVDSRAREGDGLDNRDRMTRRVACAFLMEDTCSIYPVRPLQCRGGFSEDDSYCRNLLENPEQTQQAVENGDIDGKYLLLPKMLYDSAQVGMAGALSKDGLNSQPLDFNAAMAIALGDRNIAEKWLRGWPVFEAARLHRRKGRHHDTFATIPQQ